MTEHNMILTTSDGIRLAARACGPVGDAPVILIAGWPQTLHAWRHVQARLAAAGIYSIAIDPPGLGESDLLGDVARYTTSNAATVMADALAKQGIQQYTLIGHDVGAWIAYASACSAPAGLERLVLLDAAIPGTLPEAGFPVENATRVFQFFFNAVPELPERLTVGRERVYLDWLFETKTRIAGAIGSDDIDEYLRCYRQPERMSAGFNYYRAVPASIAALADAPPLAMPVLALGAEHGVGKGLAEALAPHCSDLDGGVIAGSGHFIPEEAPNELVERLLAFIAGERT